MRVARPGYVNKRLHAVSIGPIACDTVIEHTTTGTQGYQDMAGKFELYKDGSGDFRFRLKAGNGQVIAVGEAYESKAAALNGIESVRNNALDAVLDDQTD